MPFTSAFSPRDPQRILSLLAVTLMVTIAGCRTAPKFTPLELPEALFRAKTYEDATVLASQEDKPLLLFVEADWVPDRQRMVDRVLADPSVAPLIQNRTVAVHIDAADRPDVTRSLRVKSLPQLLLVTPDGQILQRWTERPKPGPLAAELNALLSGETAEAYQFATTPASNLVARNRIAHQLIMLGRNEAALAEFLRLYTECIGRDVVVQSDLSSVHVITGIQRLSPTYPPAKDALFTLRNREQKNIEANPNNIAAAEKLMRILAALEDEEAALATYRMLPQGNARNRMKMGVAIRPLVKRKDYVAAAAELTLSEARREMARHGEPNMVQRGVIRTLFMPLAGTSLSSRFIDEVHKKALEARLYYYEIYAGAEDVTNARELAEDVLEWDRQDKAPAALRESTQRVLGERAAAFLIRLNLPALAEPTPSKP